MVGASATNQMECESNTGTVGSITTGTRHRYSGSVIGTWDSNHCGTATWPHTCGKGSGAGTVPAGSPGGCRGRSRTPRCLGGCRALPWSWRDPLGLLRKTTAPRNTRPQVPELGTRGSLPRLIA